MRLIDTTPILQDLIKIADKVEGKNPYENVKIKSYRRCFELVLSAPTVDAVPVVHGHWCEGRFNDWRNDIYEERCSVCGRYSRDYSNYCPNCGAKMDEIVAENATATDEEGGDTE